MKQINNDKQKNSQRIVALLLMCFEQPLAAPKGVFYS
jgi:hypothetical protein